MQPPFQFGHAQHVLAFWRRLIRQALELAPTPFYLFSAEPTQEALVELGVLQARVPVAVRHWLSFKTQPLPALLRWWQQRGLGVEVVSDFELTAALKIGFGPEQILVNGPAKQSWLSKHTLPGLRVNFDSREEIKALWPAARKWNWSVGVRCQTREEVDPQHPEQRAQFGMPAPEAVLAVRQLRRAGVRLETVHFHLRTNVSSPSVYERALVEVAEICEQARFHPKYLDLGGGLPPHHVLSRDGRRYDRQFELSQLANVYARQLPRFPDLNEFWLENGRFVSARSGVLVTRILDVKTAPEVRTLICDGGRTLHALISTWEEHEIMTVPPRSGPVCFTAICGPTCMAFDHLSRRIMPQRLRAGDHLVWMEAGAYHLPWETRFSHGHAGVVWHENGRLTLVREPQSFENWWAQWMTQTPRAASARTENPTRGRLSSRARPRSPRVRPG